METDIRAEQHTIGSMFANQVRLKIPFFQRNYVWEETDWERFWETMWDVATSNEKRSYFMGTIVLKNDFSSSFKSVKTIIDGQQRLITIFLFFKAICQGKDAQDFFYNNFYMYSAEKLNFKAKEKILTVSLDDEKIFEKIIGDKKNEITESEKKNKIYQCFNFFLNKNTEEIKDTEVLKIMSDVCFVIISLGQDQDEQQIFDTLNSIGFPLSTAELVKNYLFKGTKEQDIKNYEIYWKNIFEEKNREFWDRNVDTGRGKKQNIEVFFQAFFDLHNKETQSAKYGRTGSLANRYKIYFKNNEIAKNSPSQQFFLNSLKEYAEIYNKNIDSNSISGGIEFDSSLDRVNIIVHKMNNTTILPYILYILTKVKDAKERDAMLLLVESYIIRRALCKESTNSYNNFFPSLIHGISQDNVRTIYDTHKKLNDLMYRYMKEDSRHSRFPSDERLQNSLNGEEGGIINKNAKAVLYLVEKSLFDNKDSTRLLPLDSYQVEHILPRQWNDNWKGFAKDIKNPHEKENFTNRYVNKIGNLTIITAKLNSSISNANWEIKTNGRGNGKVIRHGKNKGLIECAKNIKSFDTKEWLQSKEWNKDTIDSRTKYLFDRIKEIWPAPKNP